ncbi:MFS domain-containing protein [Pycnococcus provasolii]
MATWFLLYLVSMLERADEALLPACYAAVSRTFAVSPAQLGKLTTFRAFTQSVFSLPAGAIADRASSRCTVVGFASLSWGILSLLVGLSTSYDVLLCLRACTGAALATAIPATYALLADSTNEASAGKAFGLLHVISFAGTALCTLVATPVSTVFFGGVEGWRALFFWIGLISVIAGGALAMYGVDDRRHRSAPTATKALTPMQLLRDTIHDSKYVMQISTLQIICGQGALGSMPWKALFFFALFLQTAGFTDFEAGLVTGVFLGGNAIGGLLGGYISDALARRFPAGVGRVMTAQMSVIAGIPLSILIFDVLPIPLEVNGSIPRAHLVALFSFVAGLMSICCSWCGGVNNSLMSAVISSERRSAMFAFDRFAEGVMSSFSSVLVGQLAEWIGWRRDDDGVSNARALGRAISLACACPWAICCCIYTLLYYVHPRDLRKLKEELREVDNNNNKV